MAMGNADPGNLGKPSRALFAGVSGGHLGSRRGGSHDCRRSTAMEDVMSTIGMAEDSIPLSQIEFELSRQMRDVNEHNDTPRLRARLSNLVIFCNKPDQAEVVTKA